MKSVKFAYLGSLISGIILFCVGVFLLLSINNTPQQPAQQNVAAPSVDSGSTDIIDDYTGNLNPINYLVLIKEASGLNTDSIIIANYDPKTKQINLLTIPRDTKPSNGADYKINSTFYLGTKKYDSREFSSSEQKQKAAEYATQAISNLTGISIDYYVYLEIDTIKGIIDKLGGVYFDVPADLKYNDPTQDLHINLKKGYQLLDGDKAEQLLRFRKPYNLSRAPAELREYYDGSDLKRTEMQIRFVNAMIEQKVNLLALPKLIPIINYAFDNVVTNTSLSDTLSLFSAFTRSTRPEMNTFKLYGLDRRINDADFFIYINQIENTKTRDRSKSQEIIDKYFTSMSGAFKPDPDRKYDYRPMLESPNPSNAQSDVRSDGADKP